MYSKDIDNSFELNEAMAEYSTTFNKKNSIRQSFSYAEFLKDRMLIVQAIRSGIPFHLFQLIKNESPFNDDEWADFLNISSKSLQRYKADRNYRFKPIHSEKIIEIAEVTELGKRVFEDSDKFFLWLSSPCFALGNLKPIDLVRNSYGKEMVIGELHRIDHGIFA